LAQAGNEIGTVLLFRRKSFCVKMNMLKFIPKTEYGQQTAPFLQGAFFLPQGQPA